MQALILSSMVRVERLDPVIVDVICKLSARGCGTMHYVVNDPGLRRLLLEAWTQTVEHAGYL